MTYVLAIVATALFATRLFFMVGVHLRDRSVDVVRDPFSNYALGSAKKMVSTMATVTTLAWFALAAVVWLGLPSWDYRLVATMMLVLIGVLSIVILAFPTDREGQARTRQGLLHCVCAIASFALTYSLTGDFSRLAEALGWWSAPLLVGLHWLVLVALILTVVGLLVRRLRPWFGIFERVFLFGIALFYLLTSIAMLAL